MSTSKTTAKGRQKLITLEKSQTVKPLDFNVLRKTVLIVRALHHPIRRLMVDLLLEKKSLTVTEIYIHLRMEQSVTSQHLAVLRRAGIVITSRKGKYIYYSVQLERLQEISELIQKLS